MNTIRRLLCALRGGHAWTTTEDSHGGVTTCSRCGKLQHGRSGGAPDADTYVNEGRIRGSGPD